MLEIVRRLRTATSGLHRSMKDTADAVGAFLVDVFHYLALFAIGATTVWSAAAAFIGMAAQGHASLGDILLLFIYLEIGAMVGIYFKTTHLPVRYLIYPDLYCNYGARAHADRNCRRRASDRRGHTGCNGRNSPSVIRRPGPKIRVIQISFRTAGIGLNDIKLMQRQNGS
jgi:Phosphate-starvation-inducible E family